MRFLGRLSLAAILGLFLAGPALADGGTDPKKDPTQPPVHHHHKHKHKHKHKDKDKEKDDDKAKPKS